MRIRERAYPHPVLSPWGDKDFIRSAFQPSVEVKGAKDAYSFRAKFKINNQSLRTLVEERRARYAVHVECPQTRYRCLFPSEQPEFKFEIRSSMIAGSVDVCSFLLAAEPIEHYVNTSLHPDYDGLSFEIAAGDTLAVGDEREFIAEKKDDPLRTVPSIFSIQPNSKPDAEPIDIETGGNKIVVLLSKKNHDAYRELRQNHTYDPVLNAAIVAPALAAVIEQMRASTDGEDGDIAGRHWFGVLTRRMNELGIDPRDLESLSETSMAVANRIIGQPLDACLSSLVSAAKDAEED